MEIKNEQFYTVNKRGEQKLIRCEVHVEYERTSSTRRIGVDTWHTEYKRTSSMRTI